MDSMTEMFGEPIDVYTDQEAIEDGCLVVVDEIRFPGCLFSAAVYDVIMEKVGYLSRRDGIDPDVVYIQIVMPLMQDVVLLAKSPTYAGKSLYTGNALDGNVTGRTLWFEMNESSGITVMFPEDN